MHFIYFSAYIRLLCPIIPLFLCFYTLLFILRSRTRTYIIIYCRARDVKRLGVKNAERRENYSLALSALCKNSFLVERSFRFPLRLLNSAKALFCCTKYKKRDIAPVFYRVFFLYRTEFFRLNATRPPPFSKFLTFIVSFLSLSLLHEVRYPKCVF